MHVRMVGEGRAPGVQHRGQADARAQMLGIGGDGQQGPRGRLEQGVIDHRLVVEGDVADLSRQGEHHMVIGQRQQLGLARFEPSACAAAP